MKFYVEINGDKNYIDEGVAEKYALYEGYVTPFTRLKIKKEEDIVVATEIKKAETPIPKAIDANDSEASSDITGPDEVDDSDDQINAVIETTSEFAAASDEPLTDAKETNEALSKSEDMDVNESATLVSGQPLLRNNFKALLRGDMNNCDNCMFSGWVKDSEQLKCHNPRSKDYKTENPVNFTCPEWTADNQIEQA